MKKFIALFVCLLSLSLVFAGGSSPLKAEPSLTVYTGDLVNVKMEFWLEPKYLTVERIYEAPNGNLELTLQGEYNAHYTLTFNTSDYKLPLFVVYKRCGRFDGCYRIKAWRNNMLSLVLDKDFRYPDNFYPSGTDHKYKESEDSPY
ncbi:MAG: hypothetical protein J6V90_08450 [Treponema sp.]|nr:hypothetical protein [Treponema sp.]